MVFVGETLLVSGSEPDLLRPKVLEGCCNPLGGIFWQLELSCGRDLCKSKEDPSLAAVADKDGGLLLLTALLVNLNDCEPCSAVEGQQLRLDEGA